MPCGAQVGEMEGALLAEFPHSGPRDFLVSSPDVRRPLHNHEQMMDLLCEVLKWHPCTRLSACDALDHPAWKHVPQSAEPPSPQRTPVPSLREDTELCKCRGHCGRSRCNRIKARIHYLKKMSKEVVHEYICHKTTATPTTLGDDATVAKRPAAHRPPQLRRQRHRMHRSGSRRRRSRGVSSRRRRRKSGATTARRRRR